MINIIPKINAGLVGEAERISKDLDKLKANQVLSYGTLKCYNTTASWSGEVDMHVKEGDWRVTFTPDLVTESQGPQFGVGGTAVMGYEYHTNAGVSWEESFWSSNPVSVDRNSCQWLINFSVQGGKFAVTINARVTAYVPGKLRIDRL